MKSARYSNMLYADCGGFKFSVIVRMKKSYSKFILVSFHCKNLLAEGTLLARDRGCSRCKSEPCVAIITKNSPGEEEIGDQPTFLCIRKITERMLWQSQRKAHGTTQVSLLLFITPVV